MSLTVGVNLLWLVPGEVGGSEQSTLATMRGLVDLDTQLDLQLFVLPGLVAAYPDLAERAAVTVAPIDGSSRGRRVVTESRWLVEQTRGLDLVHHAGGTVPARRSAPAVLTLHDLQPLEARATHSPVKRLYLGRAVPAAVRASRRVAVPSEFVRGAVLERFRVPPERVVAIPHAVPVRPSPTSTDVLRDRYRLTGPVVLYPGITYPHKEHETLLTAFELVLRDHPDAVLVLPGGAGSREAAVQAQIHGNLRLQQQVRRIGRVPEGDIAGLLDLADVVAVPSRYEGFGLPALEAMAAGVAVVAADGTSLPEVVGSAGLLVSAGDPEAWAEALAGLLADPSERQRLAAAGRARAAGYTVEANAAAFAQLYRDAVADS